MPGPGLRMVLDCGLRRNDGVPGRGLEGSRSHALGAGDVAALEEGERGGGENDEVGRQDQEGLEDARFFIRAATIGNSGPSQIETLVPGR